MRPRALRLLARRVRLRFRSRLRLFGSSRWSFRDRRFGRVVVTRAPVERRLPHAPAQAAAGLSLEPAREHFQRHGAVAQFQPHTVAAVERETGIGVE